MSGARVAGEVVGQRCELCSGSEETAGGSMQCIHSWLESLPMIALFECGEEVVAANDLARRFLGTDARVHLNQIFIGAYPMIKEQRRQRFECLFTPLAGATKLVTGVVQPCEAAGPEGRLVLLMEPLEDSVNDATFDGKGKSIYLEDLFDSASEAMVIVQRGRILRVNSEFERIFGYPSASCIGSSLLDLVVPEGLQHENEMLLHMVESEGRASIETVRRVRSGEELDVSIVITRVRLKGGRIGLSITYRDIRREKQMQARLQHTALHDPLTGLANRALFLDRLSLTMARLRRRPDRNFAVIFLDLDRFKQVNDTWGHSVGDTLLLAIAARLRACLRPQDTVARFGGDEFALVIDEAGCKEDIGSLAERIQCELQCPVEILDVGTVSISASLGIVLGSPAYNKVEEILRDADIAMYRAKERGKACHEFYDSDKNAQAVSPPAISQQPHSEAA